MPPHDERGNTIAAALARRGIVPASTGGVTLLVDDEVDEDDEKCKNNSNNTSGSLRVDKRPPFAPAAGASVALQATERRASLASAFYSDEDRCLELLETKQIAAVNLNDFLSWIHNEQKFERQARGGSAKDWSHKFIVNREATAWYEGPEIKIFIKATSPEQMISRLIATLKQRLSLSMDNQLVIKYNATLRSDLMAGKDPKWLLLNAEDLKLTPIHGAGAHGAGTYLKVFREKDMCAARERAHEVWMKVRRTCQQLRLYVYTVVTPVLLHCTCSYILESCVLFCTCIHIHRSKHTRICGRKEFDEGTICMCRRLKSATFSLAINLHLLPFPFGSDWKRSNFFRK